MKAIEVPSIANRVAYLRTGKINSLREKYILVDQNKSSYVEAYQFLIDNVIEFGYAKSERKAIEWLYCITQEECLKYSARFGSEVDEKELENCMEQLVDRIRLTYPHLVIGE